MLRDSGESYLVSRHDANAQEFKVNDLHTLADNDILLVCDGNNAGLFRALGVSAGSKTLKHSQTTTGTSGNCSDLLGGNGDCTAAAKPKLKIHTFGLGTQLVKFTAVGYYIGVSSGADSMSLYRRRLADNTTATYVSEEILQGVENMQILYGVNTDQDTSPERYFPANGVVTTSTDWNDVVSVRIGLLLHTPDQVSGETATRTYHLAGTRVTPAADRRMRFSFNSSVKLRNRAL